MRSDLIFERLSAASIQLAVATIAVWLLTLAFRRMPGELRAWLWRLVGLKGIVALAVVFPVAVLRQEAAPVIPKLAPSYSADSPALALPIGAEQAAEPLPTTEIILLLWAIGFMAGAGRTLAVVGRTERFVRKMRSLSGTEAGGNVIYSDSVVSPMIAGLLRPTIFLPARPDSALALPHEEAHLRRKDLLWDLAGRLFLTVFWFHPAAWLAVREHRQACEEACDEWVLRTGIAPEKYAHALLNFSAPLGARLAALSSASSDLRRRIYNMKHRPLPLSAALAAALPAVLFLIPAILVARQTPPSFPRIDVPPVTVAYSSDPLADPNIDQRAVMLLSDPWAGIKVRPAQKAKIDSIYRKLTTDMRALGARVATMQGKGMTDAYRIKFEGDHKRNMHYQAAEESLAALDADQAHRARQVSVRQMGVIALALPSVAKAMGLSEGKRQKIDAIRKERLRDDAEIQSQTHREIDPLGKDLARFLPEKDRQRYRNYASRQAPLTADEFKDFTAMQSVASMALTARFNARQRELKKNLLKHDYDIRAQRILSPSELAAFDKLIGGSRLQ